MIMPSAVFLLFTNSMLIHIKSLYIRMGINEIFVGLISISCNFHQNDYLVLIYGAIGI